MWWSRKSLQINNIFASFMLFILLIYWKAMILGTQSAKLMYCIALMQYFAWNKAGCKYWWHRPLELIFLRGIHEMFVNAVEELSLATLIPFHFISQRPEISFLMGQAQVDTLIPKVNKLTIGIYEGRWDLSQFLFFIFSLFSASIHCVACYCLNSIQGIPQFFLCFFF